MVKLDVVKRFLGILEKLESFQLEELFANHNK